MVKSGKVLLARKTRHIGADKWNGYGGGIEGKESLAQCVIRECQQESGVEIDSADLKKVAEVTFHNTKTDGEKFSCLVHVFITEHWVGEPRESEEMVMPTWFSFDQLPVAEMMLADSTWVPLVLAGKKIIGEAHYGPFQKKLLKPVVITEVSSFD
ncbi:MAG: NUDIX domain-containing protein [Candidatus Vogelbacteria bacterium]